MNLLDTIKEKGEATVPEVNSLCDKMVALHGHTGKGVFEDYKSALNVPTSENYFVLKAFSHAIVEVFVTDLKLYITNELSAYEIASALVRSYEGIPLRNVSASLSRDESAPQSFTVTTTHPFPFDVIQLINGSDKKTNVTLIQSDQEITVRSNGLMNRGHNESKSK